MKKQESGSSPKLSTKPDAPLTPLKELFTDGIRDPYWAENYLVKSLHKMISAASSPELVSAIESHLTYTKGHVERIEQIFILLGEKPVATNAMRWRDLPKKERG